MMRWEKEKRKGDVGDSFPIRPKKYAYTYARIRLSAFFFDAIAS